jgi:hypothetical protein
VYNQSRQDLASDYVITRGKELGFHFKHLVSEVEEVALASLSIQPEPVPDDPWYQTMWFLRPVADGVFTSGQIQKNYLPLLEDGITTYINLRRAAMTNGVPTQEEVTLLNIRDRTGTYVGAGRQSEERLLATRRNSARPVNFISQSSDINYERRNALEYGDEIGYNESTSRKHIQDNYKLQYTHTPIGMLY